MIRPAELKDAEPIAQVIVTAWQTAYTGIVDPSFPPSMKPEVFIRIMKENIQQEKETIFVFTTPRYEDHIIGFISGRTLGAWAKYDAEVIGSGHLRAPATTASILNKAEFQKKGRV